MMFVNHKIKGIPVHQLINFTRSDRYPKIFSACASLKNGDIKILSFGCSTGIECKSIREYFPNAKIIGVDINKDVLTEAAANNKDKNIKFYEEVCENNFDYIFCMSILCRHPDTVHEQDCSRHYSFKLFEETLKDLIGRLKPTGCIIIYNSNFRFSDTKFAPMFKSVPTFDEHESGFVIKFDKNNTRLKDQSYKDCVFVRTI